jgi:hypothetical protein
VSVFVESAVVPAFSTSFSSMASKSGSNCPKRFVVVAPDEESELVVVELSAAEA